MAHPFPRIEAAAIDGRLHTLYHRQVQLERLCKALIANVNEIKQAIEQDYTHTFEEIATEYHTTLTTVKQHYSLLNPKEAHEEEYLVANGRDAPHTRAPAGIVYIEPTAHTFFYSSIVPLAAALAAGNCVVLLVSTHFFPHFIKAKLTQIAASEQSTFASRATTENPHLIFGCGHLCHCLFAGQARCVP